MDSQVRNERVIAMNYQVKDGVVENDHYGLFYRNERFVGSL
jgi:hypothetical protein